MRHISFLTALFASLIALAQAPAGYYESARGTHTDLLLQRLENIVGQHTNVGYSGLYDVYRTSDITADGYVWDMYSTAKYTFDDDQCGNYSYVGDCFNREHSFPKSWFGGERAPMYSDAFHIYPTDGRVNGQRSNYPYGECASGSSVQSHNGVRPLGRLGNSTFPGYSGVVFEPDDQYKGDFARSYFYMAAAYNSQIADWSSPMLAGNDFPAFSSWAIDLLLKWHRQDPVSQKEIDRNNAVYVYQHNRNPFIDHPELAEHIWGNAQDSPWQPGSAIPVLAMPSAGQEINLGVVVTGQTINAAVNVLGASCSQAATITCSDPHFTLSASSLSAEQINKGTYLNVTYTSSADGKHRASVNIHSTEIDVTFYLSAESTSGIPALPASDVTADSFVANWIDVDQVGNYQFFLYRADAPDAPLAGYPVSVTTADEMLLVEDLSPLTTYTYLLQAPDGRKSNSISVTTLDCERIIALNMPQGGVHLTATAGQPSQSVEASVYTENITEDITLSVGEPFELSLDKDSWSNQLTINPDGEQFFIRLKASAPAGSYSAELWCRSASFEGQESTVYGVVEEVADFILEDFEPGYNEHASYSTQAYSGSAANWLLTNAGLYSRSGDKFHGNQGVCTAKSGSREISMTSDKTNGVGNVTFYAAPFSNDAESTVQLSYRTDTQTEWTTLPTTITVPKSSSFTKYSIAVNVPGNVRISLVQASGARLNIDDICIENYPLSAINGPEAERTWDAVPAHNAVIITSREATLFEIYAFDARLTAQPLVNGTASIALAPGIYVVTDGVHAKKIIVKD